MPLQSWCAYCGEPQQPFDHDCHNSDCVEGRLHPSPGAVTTTEPIAIASFDCGPFQIHLTREGMNLEESFEKGLIEAVSKFLNDYP